MVTLIPVLLAGAALPAIGQTSSTIVGQCMQDRYGSKLNCTANDVRIAKAEILSSTGCRYVGDVVDFTAKFTVETTATERYDIGLYFAVDGDPNKDGAYTGTCSVSTLPIGPSPFINIDQYDRYGNDTGDRCGDIGTKYANPLYPVITVEDVVCVDTDRDGFLDFPNCTSWRQSGDSLCDDPTDAFPGTTSKCKCDIGFDVPITVPPGELKVTKTAVPESLPEPGGKFRFDFTVENSGVDPNNYVVITKLVDKVGTVETSLLDSSKVSCTGPGLTSAPVPYGYQLPNGQKLSCSFFSDVTNQNAGFTQTDTVIATGHDRNFPTEELSGQASATIIITDVLPAISITKSADPTQVNEGPASPVIFTVVITNQSTASTDDLTITSLGDDIYGSLVGKATCGGSLLSLPHTLAYGGTLTCSFTGNVPPSGWGQPGQSYTDKVTVIAHDDDPSTAHPNGNEVSHEDTATVSIIDAGAATIEVVKTAMPQSVPETGGLVSYGVSIKNLSTVDTVYIDTLQDTVFGNIADPNNAQLTPAGAGGARTTCNILPLTLKPGALATCYFYAYLSGEPTVSHVNVLTASGLDDDQAPVSDSDDETVTFSDVQPNASVDKTATSLRVTYAVVVANLAVEPMKITSLVDNQFGDLTNSANPKLISTTCAAGVLLAKAGDSGASYACSFVADVTKSPHTNTVTATVDDNDAASPPSEPTSSAVVTFGKP